MTIHTLLVRHARPRIDPAVPSADWTLSEAGEAAAERLAQRLSGFAPTAALASPEPKAFRTAELVCGRLGLSPRLHPDLAETRRRTVGFLSAEAVEAGVAAFFANPGRLVFGEETADAAFERFSAALESARTGDGPLLVVSHGTIISLYVSRVSGADPMDIWRSLTLPHALALGADGQVAESIPAE